MDFLYDVQSRIAEQISYFIQMPPKRPATGGGGAGGKKAKTAPTSMKKASAVLKAADKKKGKKIAHKPDSFCTLSGAEVC